MPTIAINLTVIHIQNEHETLETEILETKILAPTSNIKDWAYEEMSEGGVDIFLDHLKETNTPDGIYSIMAFCNLTGGTDSATPDHSDEGWTLLEKMSEFHVLNLNEENSAEFLEVNAIELTVEEKKHLFKSLPFSLDLFLNN